MKWVCLKAFKCRWPSNLLLLHTSIGYCDSPRYIRFTYLYASANYIIYEYTFHMCPTNNTPFPVFFSLTRYRAVHIFKVNLSKTCDRYLLSRFKCFLLIYGKTTGQSKGGTEGMNIVPLLCSDIISFISTNLKTSSLPEVLDHMWRWEEVFSCSLCIAILIGIQMNKSLVSTRIRIVCKIEAARAAAAEAAATAIRVLFTTQPGCPSSCLLSPPSSFYISM